MPAVTVSRGSKPQAGWMLTSLTTPASGGAHPRLDGDVGSGRAW
jgi:hypothetical protein